MTGVREKFQQQLRGLQKSRRGLIALLVMFGCFNMACSTPQVPYVDPNPQDTAWYAYQQCLAAHPGINTARANVCDRAGEQNGQSYYYYTSTVDTMSLGYAPDYYNGGTCMGCMSYTGSPATNYWTRGYRSTARGPVDPAEGYRAFLGTLDEESLARLTAEWLALASTP